MKKLTFTIISLLTSIAVVAQLPTDFRSEQIYLNLEKHVYLPEDTISLEGQVTCIAGERFLPHSNYLYIECFNEKDSVLVRQKVSCKDNGYFSTHLPTDYLWPAGVYYLRAYTLLMRNFSSESFAQQPFLLGKEFPKKEEQVYEAKCVIVPSGGKLVSGHPQTATVWLADECTFPICSELLLKDEKGDTISTVRTSQSGMALLRFIPKPNVRYHLEGNIDGNDYRFPLPEITNGIKIQGNLNGKRLNYQVLNGDEDISKYILYTFDRQNGLTRTNIPKANGILMLGQSAEVMTLFLTDRNNQVLSQYTLAGKQEREDMLQAADKIKINEAIRFEIPSLPEGAKVMTRIVAENDLLATTAEMALKYMADYTSPLPFPNHLYASDQATFNNDLHAWLSTASFHRFDLKDAIAKDTALYVYQPEEVMSFSGKIEKKSRRPLKGGQLVAYHTVNDFVYDVPLTSDSARFRMAVDDFMEGEEFFLQAITAKEKPDFASYHIDDETFPVLVNNRRFRLPLSRYTHAEVTIGNELDLQYTIGKDKVRNYTLPNVTVKARLKTEEPKPTHEFYSVNYADQEEIEEKGYLTLYHILKSMPGIVITYNPTTGLGSSPVADPKDVLNDSFNSKYSIRSSRGTSTLGGAYIPIIVDNTRFTSADYDYLLNMPSFEIEFVQVLKPWQALAYTYGAVDGAILVKTRSYKERPPLPSKGAMYSPMGLSPLSYPFKEYAPEPWKAEKPGRYRLLVDVITESGVQSYEKSFEVVP